MRRIRLFHSLQLSRFKYGHLLAAILGVRLLFVLVHPLVIEGDGINYFLLMQSGSSSLLHAPGYPLFFSSLIAAAKKLGVNEREVLRVVQQVLPSLAAAFLFVPLQRVLGKNWAALGTLLVGTSYLAIKGAATTRPEFFSACVGVFLLGLLLRQALSERPRPWLYLGAGATLALGYVVKPNFIAFLPLWLLLAAAPWSRFQRLRVGLASLAAALVTLGAFFVGIQHPKTGSWALNLEHGWIHYDKLRDMKLPIEAANGENSLRLLVGANFLTETKRDFLGLWSNVDSVPRAERTFWSAKLSEETDRLTPEAKAALTAQGDMAFLRLYQRLGIEEGDAVLNGVFRETLLAHPGRAASAFLASFADSLDLARHYRPYAPGPYLWPETVWRSRLPKPCVVLSVPSGLRALTAFVSAEGLDACEPTMRTGPTKMWAAGLNFFGALSVFELLRFLVFWPLVGVSLGWMAFEGAMRPRGLELWMWLVSLSTLFAQLVFSAVIYRFRTKELMQIDPVLILLTVLSMRRVVFALSQRSSGGLLGVASGKAM